MVDLLGNPLAIGDYVIFCVAGYQHSIKIMAGKILRFTDKMVKIKYIPINDVALLQKKKVIESNRAPTSLILYKDDLLVHSKIKEILNDK